MTATSPRLPRRSHARSNHARILTAARAELSRDPDVSLEGIARAAGVVRRTLYEHFPKREALIDALADEASQSLEEAFTAARRPDADPASALARLILAAWAVGDHYRMLIALARRRLGEERLRAILAPARAEAASILERGQRDGTFASHLPAPVLALATESVALVILEAQGSGDWSDPAGEAAATAVLITAGVDPAAAWSRVQAILSEAPAAPPGQDPDPDPDPAGP
jgi:AcrR family transcriptional regulator